MKELNENMILSVLSVISVFFIFKTSSDPIWSLFHYEISILNQFPTGNNIIFNLSIGIFVSIIFYILIVKYPEYKKKEIIKNNMRKQYELFRFATITSFLNHCSKEEFSKLKYKDIASQKEFRKYFEEKNTRHLAKLKKLKWSSNTIKLTLKDYQYQYNEFCKKSTKVIERWDCVISELDEYEIENILVEIEILIIEISYIFNNTHIENPEVHDFFKNLKGEMYRARHSDLEDGNSKIVLRTIWSLLSGWDSKEGYRDNDIIDTMIESI